jgi:hypothetical protein
MKASSRVRRGALCRRCTFAVKSARLCLETLDSGAFIAYCGIETLSMPVELQTHSASDDIILYDIPLPMRATLFPLGFPLELATNSAAVIAAARQSWSSFAVAHPEIPISFSLAVTEHDDERLPPRPKFRAHRHMMSIVSDAQNNVICDFSRNCASGWITRRVAENAGFLRLHFLESSVMTVLVAAHLAPMHGALVARRGVGVALCGESFAGKSTLAYACARSGWTFVSDDGTFLLRNRADRYAVGNPYNIRFREDAKFLFPELADNNVARRHNGALGIEARTSELPISTAGGCSIDHIVFLRRSRSGRPGINRLEAGEAQRRLGKATLYGPEEVRVSQRLAYRRLLDAGLWELYYSDLPDAVQMLDQLGAAA